MKTPDPFWDADLEEIEASFLDGKKITDLPTHLDDRVPPQGSVYLNRIINLDHQGERVSHTPAAPKPTRPSLLKRVFDRLVFG